MECRERMIRRIARHEELLDQVAAANRQLAEALTAFRQAEEAAAELSAYYGSEQWRQDLDADEKGLLPPELRRVVLSEDGAWNALSDRAELASCLREEAE